MKKAPHLLASGLALFASLMLAIAFTAYANLFEQKYIHGVAALDHTDVLKGSAIQRMALRQDDLLVMFGASEITLLKTKYQAHEFFSTYPTGFMVFEVANKGASSLAIAQSIAAMGSDLRGKKVVFSTNPSIMTMAPLGGVNEDNYNPNFSQLHALELTFSPYLSMETKQLAARRMLEFPGTLHDNPILKFALEKLARNSTSDQILYSLAWPLGRLQIAIIRLQDHYSVVNYIRHLSSEELEVIRQPEELDWSALVETAAQEQMRNSTSNPYGVDDTKWNRISELLASPIPPGSKDEEFIEDLKNATEWGDTEIVLRVLDEMGAEALILSRPMNIHIWEAIGVSAEAQNTYYLLLHDLVEPYGMPVIDYKEFEEDKYFSIDLASHTSRKGWIYVNQTLDQFFHGDLR